MRRFEAATTLLLVPLLAAGCGEDPQARASTVSGAPADTRAAEVQLEQIRTKWVEAALAGDAAALGELYTDDAVMVMPDGRTVEGREGILRGLSLEGLAVAQLRSADVEVGRDVASDLGTFVQSRQNGEAMTGRYVMVLRLQPDGRWQIKQHVASTLAHGIPQPVDSVPGVAEAGPGPARADTAAEAPPPPARPANQGPRILGTPIP